MVNCRICKYPITESFCPNCGNPAKLKRIDKHYISHEVFHLLHFEKGFFYTVRELFTRPGNSIREFIEENRNRHMKPVAFLILASLLFTLISHLFHADEIYNQKDKLSFGKSSINDIMHWVQTHWGYANLLMGIFIALCLKLFFKKYKYNLFEITILLCFVMGQAMLILTIATFFVGILKSQIFIIISSVIGFVYVTWAIGQFFGGTKVANYVKAFLAYLLGYLLFYIAIIPVGLAADLIIKIFKMH
ncbi:MAG: DUF3667 domain-containing protein [Ferruginibacter sp.]